MLYRNIIQLSVAKSSRFVNILHIQTQFLNSTKSMNTLEWRLSLPLDQFSISLTHSLSLPHSLFQTPCIQFLSNETLSMFPTAQVFPSFISLTFDSIAHDPFRNTPPPTYPQPRACSCRRYGHWGMGGWAWLPHYPLKISRLFQKFQDNVTLCPVWRFSEPRPVPLEWAPVSLPCDGVSKENSA